MEAFLLSDTVQFYMGLINRTASLNRFLVTNALDQNNMTVLLSIKKVPQQFEKQVRHLAALNMVPDEVQEKLDAKREKLKNLLKNITSEILAKWEF